MRSGGAKIREREEVIGLSEFGRSRESALARVSLLSLLPYPPSELIRDIHASNRRLSKERALAICCSSIFFEGETTLASQLAPTRKLSLIHI